MPAKRAVAERRDAISARSTASSPDGRPARRPAAAASAACRSAQVHCPLHNNIPDWLKLTAEGRLEEAYEVSSATNNFPEICGRICPQDRLCEGNCVIEKGFGTVTIGAVEKLHHRHRLGAGLGEADPAAARAGPVGRHHRRRARPGWRPPSSCAARATRCTVYDRYDRVGGLMIYGIPGFKLEKDVVLRRWRLLEEGGIRFTSNCEVGDGRRLGRAARPPRRGADRDRRLQGARHRRPRRPGCRASCRRSTI